MELSHLLYIRASFHQHMKERKRGTRRQSFIPFSLCMCVYLCVSLYMSVYFCPYGSSEKIEDGTSLTRSVNDPELGPYLNILQYLNYFRVNFMNLIKIATNLNI